MALLLIINNLSTLVFQVPNKKNTTISIQLNLLFVYFLNNTLQTPLWGFYIKKNFTMFQTLAKQYQVYLYLWNVNYIIIAVVKKCT